MYISSRVQFFKDLHNFTLHIKTFSLIILLSVSRLHLFLKQIPPLILPAKTLLQPKLGFLHSDAQYLHQCPLKSGHKGECGMMIVWTTVLQLTLRPSREIMRAVPNKEFWLRDEELTGLRNKGTGILIDIFQSALSHL